jgi:hypothetical protein
MKKSHIDLGLFPGRRYDAVIRTANADEHDSHLATDGTVGCVELYPAGAGCLPGGEFDVEKWEAAMHHVMLSFHLSPRGYREAVVVLAHQAAPVDIIEPGDIGGYHELERIAPLGGAL